MQRYVSLLKKMQREYTIKYFILKFVVFMIILLYYSYLNKFLDPQVWDLGLKFFIFIRDLTIAGLFAIIYGLYYVALYFVEVYSLGDAYSVALIFLGSMLKVNPDTINQLLSGFVGYDILSLIVSVFAVLLILSIVLNVGFIVRGNIGFFMWSMALIIFSIVGLVALGYANMHVLEWPPASINELIANPVVIMAVFTFFVIEVCGSLSYAAEVVDGYLRKIVRMRSLLDSLIHGRLTEEISAREASVENTGGLQFSPLASILLRGYTGIYALEETSSELASKIMGFIRSEGGREKDFMEQLLGMRGAPKLVTISIVVLTNLLVKLPLSVFLAVIALLISNWLAALYPNVIEVQTPAFTLFVFVFVMVLIYLIGNFITTRKLI